MISADNTLYSSNKFHLSGPEKELWQAAQALESSFLSEMLKTAGVGKPPEALGGGAGEGQFASFLVDEQAKAMVAAGGIGLADVIFEALKEHADAG